jgi:hypothetical protein
VEELPSISYFVWQAPETAITVQISLEVIERIRALIARDSAAGGVLRGAVLPSGGGTVVVVDDFESAADEARLAARAGLPSVVGRWRAHTGTPLAPLDADASEMALYFPQPWKVLLLVGSDGGENPTAGFFTWINGALVSKCAREFPFHSGALLAASAPLVEGPQRSRPLELREGHGWRASAVSAIVAAMALAGGMWYWHRPDSPGVAKQPAAALAPSQPPALSAGVHIPQPAPQINVQPAPQIDVPLPDLPRPSAMPRPASAARPSLEQRDGPPRQ